MKATFDLPADLVRQLKLRALRDGQKLKDAAADVLRAGLAAEEPSAPSEKPAAVRKDKKTGVPVVQCHRRPPRGQELTPERVADILTAQEAEWAKQS